MTGRFAPSPTGDLHLGNLRTAAVAWLSARSAGRSFIVRMEDLDRNQASREHELTQLADLAAIGLDWDGEVVRQSERFDRYEAALDLLRADGLVYECFCSRREIREEIAAAALAAHLPPGAYPGTCRDLDAAERDDRRAGGRPPALRLRTDGRHIDFDDRVAGRSGGAVDDVVLRRNDGVPAYNLAVVVDDHLQSVTEVVRGDDLLSSTPRQILIQRLLAYETPGYVHVPLVVGRDGDRLAKRDGAVTVRELRAAGVPVAEVIVWIATSLELAAPGEAVTMGQLVSRFDPERLPGDVCRVPDLAPTAPPGPRHDK